MARRKHVAWRNTGFTLVELLVALMVMALLSLMSWRGLDAMGRAQSQTQARADELLVLQSGLAQWSADLDAMATELSNPRAINSLPSAMEWNGLVFRITRNSSGTRASTSSGSAEPGLQVVAWTLGQEQGHKVWMRWQSPVVRTRAALEEAWLEAGLWAQSPTDASRTRQVRILPLLDWQIFYFRNDAWTNPGSSSDAANVNPDGVRLILNLPEGSPLVGLLTRDWMRATASGNKT
jgi:general secretion pathway protein J